MNRKQSQQIYTHPDLSLINKNTYRPLLEQTLPKYRKQILERNFDNYTKDLTSRVKEKYRNFGQEDFIKKLKYNSTKQIDRKSIKAIDKYLHELNQQKQQPMGYLHRTTSMKGLNNINEKALNNENQQNIQQPKIKLNKNVSLSIIPSTMNTNSEQTVNIAKRNQNNLKGNKSRQQQAHRQHLSGSNDETIKESAKFRENQSEKWGNKHNSGSRERNFVNIMSFRNNVESNQSGVSSSKDLRPDPKQSISKDQQQEQRAAYMASQNNFYHKFVSPNTKVSNVHNKFPKERPTVDTSLKRNQVSQGQKWLSKNSSILVQEQLRILREKNSEQQQIIKLQQIMIEKLNVQLQNVLQRLQQKQDTKGKAEQDVARYENDDQVNSLMKATAAKASRQQYLICLQVNQHLKGQVQNASCQWSAGFDALKNILGSIQFDQDQQFQQTYLCQAFEAKQFHENQQEANVTHSAQQNQPIKSQSANFFYHLPRNSQSFSGMHKSKDIRPSELSNFFTLSSQPDRRELQYSAGTDFQFDLVEEIGMKEE